MSREALRVAVVGRDADLWLTASVLGRALGSTGVRVIAIEMPSRVPAGHVTATLPPIEALHEKLKIEEASLLRTTRGSFSFGQNVVAPGRQAFFHAWGAYGASIDGNPFFQCWLRAVRSGLSVPLQGFCPSAIAATNGRMLLPDDATVAFGRTDYGYHLNTLAYLALLKSLSAAAGVVLHRTSRITVQRGADGDIAALLLDDSTAIKADLFVDATRESSLLASEALEVPRTSWQAHFPADRALSSAAPAFTAIPPFAEIRITPLGLAVLHPTQSATGVVFAFSSRQMSDEVAAEQASRSSGAALRDVAFSSLKPGVLTRCWERNCIAVGAAACSVDPVHDVEMHVLQLGIVHLLSLFPVSGHFDAERLEYNRLMRSHYDRLRDFQIAFYHCAPFSGDFWAQHPTLDASEALADRIAIYKARALIAPMENESFSSESWEAVLLGLGVVPEGWSPAINAISWQRLNDEFGRMLQFVRAKVLEQPMHGAYLDSLCASGA
ncbi:MAG TPA: tryptophan 7-halogenase [Steroidobacteraceae bacterium]